MVILFNLNKSESMKSKFLLFAICALFVATLASCGGGGDDPTPSGGGGGTTTNSDLLDTWKVSAVKEGTQDITAAFSAYRITFADDNGTKSFTLINRQGNTLTGTWALSSNETDLTLTFSDNTTLKLTNVSISSSKLSYTADEQGKTGPVSLSFTLIPA